MCGNVLNLLWHICDQIWRNFASLGGFYFGHFKALFSKWQSFEHTLAHFDAFGQLFIVANGQI